MMPLLSYHNQWRIQDFPVGVDLVGGGVDSRGGYVLKNLYVKTKESGPLGGHAPGTTSSRSANDNYKSMVL